MPDQPKSTKSPTDAKIDAAIAAAANPPSARLQIGLPNGRAAMVEFPIPLSPEEALRITGAFQTAYLQQFDAEKRTVSQSGLVLPT